MEKQSIQNISQTILNDIKTNQKLKSYQIEPDNIEISQIPVKKDTHAAFKIEYDNNPISVIIMDKNHFESHKIHNNKLQKDAETKSWAKKDIDSLSNNGIKSIANDRTINQIKEKLNAIHDIQYHQAAQYGYVDPHIQLIKDNIYDVVTHNNPNVDIKNNMDIKYNEDKFDAIGVHNNYRPKYKKYGWESHTSSMPKTLIDDMYKNRYITKFKDRKENLNVYQLYAAISEANNFTVKTSEYSHRDPLSGWDMRPKAIYDKNGTELFEIEDIIDTSISERSTLDMMLRYSDKLNTINFEDNPQLNDIKTFNDFTNQYAETNVSNNKDDKLEQLKNKQYKINDLAMRELDPDNKYKHDNFVEIQKQPMFLPVINSRLYIEDKSNFDFIVTSLDFDTRTDNDAKPNDKIEVQSKLLNSIAKEYTRSYAPRTHEQKDMEYMFSNADPKAINRFNENLANEYAHFPGALDQASNKYKSQYTITGEKLGNPFTYDMKKHQLITTKEIDDIILKHLNDTHYHTIDKKNESKYFDILDKIGANAKNLNSMDDITNFINQQFEMKSENQNNNNNKFEQLSLNLDNLQEQKGLTR